MKLKKGLERQKQGTLQDPYRTIIRKKRPSTTRSTWFCDTTSRKNIVACRNGDDSLLSPRRVAKKLYSNSVRSDDLDRQSSQGGGSASWPSLDTVPTNKCFSRTDWKTLRLFLTGHSQHYLCFGPYALDAFSTNARSSLKNRTTVSLLEERINYRSNGTTSTRGLLTRSFKGLPRFFSLGDSKIHHRIDQFLEIFLHRQMYQNICLRKRKSPKV